ncbi:GNAT family N-acetyltransferase [Allokutzneria oryzae]|uniref:GNAT family N-acetyltransferase n=1 Tax=Allokutzneria oryzae TaxID=1378989 RepID=A0ABV6A1B0_9PSEU
MTVLDDLDRQRCALGVSDGAVVREFSPDGTECRIVFAYCADSEIEDVIGAEKARADAHGYSVEWKVYSHDALSGMEERLLAAGFEAEPVEQVLVLPLTEDAVAAFDSPGVDVRRVRDEAGLRGVAEISRSLGRGDVDAEVSRLSDVLRESPAEMSVHVAYLDRVPVSCGRLHFAEDSQLAELAGGRTNPAYQRRGLFVAVVGSRLREAVERGRTHVVVDALPTSEPILLKRGFERLTSTQPFAYTAPHP